jgi:hypothetical protein
MRIEGFTPWYTNGNWHSVCFGTVPPSVKHFTALVPNS